MPSLPFTVADHEYIVGDLNARQQFDIVRRLGLINWVFEAEVTDDHTPAARWMAGLLSGNLADIPQVDMDLILNICFSVVTRKNSVGKFIPAFNNAGLPQFNDIDMEIMLELADRVVQESLGPFYERLRARRRATLAEAEAEADSNQSE